MKKMKFMLTTMFLALLSLVLVSCGEKDQTVSYTQEQAMEKIATSAVATQAALTGNYEVTLEVKTTDIEVTLSMKATSSAASINVKATGNVLLLFAGVSSVEANLTLVNNTIYFGLFMGSDTICVKASNLYDGFDDLLAQVVEYIETLSQIGDEDGDNELIGGMDLESFDISSILEMAGLSLDDVYGIVDEVLGMDLSTMDATTIMGLIAAYEIDMSEITALMTNLGYTSIEQLLADEDYASMVISYVVSEVIIATIMESLEFSYTGGKTNTLVIVSDLVPAKVTLAFDSNNVFKSLEVAITDMGTFKLSFKTTGVTVSAPKNANLYSDISSIPGFEITSIADLLDALFTAVYSESDLEGSL